MDNIKCVKNSNNDQADEDLWMVGDICLALYSLDKKYYEAIIESISSGTYRGFFFLIKIK